MNLTNILKSDGGHYIVAIDYPSKLLTTNISNNYKDFYKKLNELYEPYIKDKNLLKQK